MKYISPQKNYIIHIFKFTTCGEFESPAELRKNQIMSMQYNPTFQLCLGTKHKGWMMKSQAIILHAYSPDPYMLGFKHFFVGLKNH